MTGRTSLDDSEGETSDTGIVDSFIWPSTVVGLLTSSGLRGLRSGMTGAGGLAGNWRLLGRAIIGSKAGAGITTESYFSPAIHARRAFSVSDDCQEKRGTSVAGIVDVVGRLLCAKALYLLTAIDGALLEVEVLRECVPSLGVLDPETSDGGVVLAVEKEKRDSIARWSGVSRGDDPMLAGE